MTVFKTRPGGDITPVRVHEKIGALITEGYPQKQAVAVAYSEARRDWEIKHPRKTMPSWLTMGDRGKNPISEKTAHKLRKAAPKTFMKMTDEEIKKAVKVKKKRVKNPVRKLKLREYHVQVSLDKIHWTLVARFMGKAQAFEYAKALHKKQPFNYVRVRT